MMNLLQRMLVVTFKVSIFILVTIAVLFVFLGAFIIAPRNTVDCIRSKFCRWKRKTSLEILGASKIGDSDIFTIFQPETSDCQMHNIDLTYVDSSKTLQAIFVSGMTAAYLGPTPLDQDKWDHHAIVKNVLNCLNSQEAGNQ